MDIWPEWAKLNEHDIVSSVWRIVNLAIVSGRTVRYCNGNIWGLTNLKNGWRAAGDQGHFTRKYVFSMNSKSMIDKNVVYEYPSKCIILETTVLSNEWWSSDKIWLFQPKIYHKYGLMQIQCYDVSFIGWIHDDGRILQKFPLIIRHAMYWL